VEVRDESTGETRRGDRRRKGHGVRHGERGIVRGAGDSGGGDGESARRRKDRPAAEVSGWAARAAGEKRSERTHTVALA
jgi:hypothetical protein